MVVIVMDLVATTMTAATMMPKPMALATILVRRTSKMKMTMVAMVMETALWRSRS